MCKYSDMKKENVPNCFYRVSVKALILNDTRDKFLIIQEENGQWELPGGGLEWGATPQEDLPREIGEEMGLPVLSVAEHPSYFFTVARRSDNTFPYIANVLYETTLKHLDFTPSDECIATQFVNTEDIIHLDVFPNVRMLAKSFDPKRHIVG